MELRPHNITVNAYAPGLILTEMSAVFPSLLSPTLTAATAKSPKDEGHEPGWAIKQVFDIHKFRGGEPDDVANVVSFIAKEESTFVTGQTISVDDGIHM